MPNSCDIVHSSRHFRNGSIISLFINAIGRFYQFSRRFITDEHDNQHSVWRGAPALHYREIITIKIPSDSANSRLICDFIPSNFSFECLFFLEGDLVKILSMSLWTKNQRLSSVCAQSRAMTANISGQTSCKIQLDSDTCPNRCV